MKKSVIVAFILISLLMGCDETSKTVISTTDDFTRAGNGTMNATIEKAGGNLNLKGNLDLNKGEFNIYLSNPSGDTIYSVSFKDSGSYKINETFNREIGKWVFSYSIVIVDDVSPSEVSTLT
jgi:hypothetical protein